MPKPITPSRIFPAGAPLPGGSIPPPPPPAPPVFPPIPAPGGEWWRRPPPPAPVAVPPPIDITIHIDPAAWLPAQPEPAPGPPWWRRLRLGYNAACILCAFPAVGLWADVLRSVRDADALAGAWVIATVPFGLAAFADNVHRIRAAHADPDLWAPKVRAAAARTALWTTILGPAIALPIVTITYLITGVRP
ncbi:hypothetical protein ACWCWD_06410 [Streptomyces sp. NPDC001493]